MPARATLASSGRMVQHGRWRAFRPNAVSGVHHHAGGLVDDDQRVVPRARWSTAAPAPQRERRRGSAIGATVIVSPAETRCLAAAGAPPTVTRPPSIHVFSRLRECCGMSCASACRGASRRTVTARSGHRQGRGRTGALSYNWRPRKGRATMLKIVRIAVALMIVSGVIGCSWLPEVKEETTGWSAEKIYSEAARRAGVGQL